MIGLCLAVGATLVALHTDTVDLRWKHSVQKTEWRETWQATGKGLQVLHAGVQSSGAGMDPGPNARLVNGFWVWTPALPPQPDLILTRSPYTGGDWHICIKGKCRDAGSYFPGIAIDQAVTLKPCG